MNQIFNWIKAHKIETLIILIIITTAAAFRLYRISDYMTFLGDEGRDAIVVKRFITEGDPIFIGPTTSVGNMYLGPAYYYMMAPFFALWGLSPLGPAVMVALLGTITVGLIYFIGKTLFVTEVGLIAAALYAVSPAIILSSRSSWNPNPMPFFALLVIFSLYKLITSKKSVWLLFTSATLAFALQMHYLGLLLIPSILIVWFWHFLTIRHTLYAIRHLVFYSLISIILFLIIMSPLVIFDLNPEHRLLNFNAFKKFFLERAATEEHLATVNLNPLNAIPRIIPVYVSFFENFAAAKNKILANTLAIISIPGLLFSFFSLLKDKKAGLLILTIWLGVGIFGLSLYKLQVYDHYFGFLNPAVFLLIAILLWQVFRINQIARIFVLIISAYLIIMNLQKSPLLLPPNNQLEKTQRIVKFIIDKSDNKPFNFALIAQNNYDSAYQYYFNIYAKKPVTIDNQNLENTITDQLFVVCEDTNCQPLGFPKWEVSGFGKAKGLAEILESLDFEGIKLYKLVHGGQKF